MGEAPARGAIKIYGAAAGREAGGILAENGGFMTRGTQIICILGGVFLFGLGSWKLYSEGDWVLVILSVLIIVFTLSSMRKQKKNQ